MTSTLFPIKKDDEIKVTPYGGAWVNLLRNGAYNKVHNHPGAVWSAVYYVSLGRPDKTIPDNGLIEFMDPRPGNIHGGKEKIEPEDGLLIIFPSWLYHYVNPYQGEMERISIAFNICSPTWRWTHKSKRTLSKVLTNLKRIAESQT